MEQKQVFPRFTESEAKRIDEFVKNGVGKNRSDFVRTATLAYLWKLEESK